MPRLHDHTARTRASFVCVALLCVACEAPGTGEMASETSGMSGIGGAGGANAGGGGMQAGTFAPPLGGMSGGMSAGAGGVGEAGAAGFGGGGGIGGAGGIAGGASLAGSGGASGIGVVDAGHEDASDAPATFAPCPASGEPCKILPFGDSITFGIGYSGGYRVELFRRALADGKRITFTGSEANGPTMVEGEPFPRNNEGHSGWKIDDIAGLVPDPALQAAPHIVLLMIGTNDVAQSDDLDAAPERLGALIDTLATNAPEALIVVATIIPLAFGSSGVEAYNEALPAVIEARARAGVHVQLVDAYEGFPTSELGDGVHPNQQGYERLAGVFYDSIKDLLH